MAPTWQQSASPSAQQDGSEAPKPESEEEEEEEEEPDCS